MSLGSPLSRTSGKAASNGSGALLQRGARAGASGAAPREPWAHWRAVVPQAPAAVLYLHPCHQPPKAGGRGNVNSHSSISPGGDGGRPGGGRVTSAPLSLQATKGLSAWFVACHWSRGTQEGDMRGWEQALRRRRPRLEGRGASWGRFAAEPGVWVGDEKIAVQQRVVEQVLGGRQQKAHARRGDRAPVRRAQRVRALLLLRWRAGAWGVR